MSTEAQAVFRHVLDKLYGRAWPQTPVGSSEISDNIYNMLVSTVNLQRGDSCLVAGPRSCGKSLIIKRCLERLSQSFPGQFVTVELNGLVHTDDKMALRAISKQLDRQTEAQTDAEKIEKSSISTTLQNILNMFQEAETAAELAAEDEMPGARADAKVSVVFVVEELDRFATTNKQTLLYNLLDLAQSSSIGVCVIGVTSRMNVGEALEKRVRSRFSQRCYTVSRPRSFEDFSIVCLALLKVDDPHLLDTYGEYCQDWNRNMEALMADGSLQNIAAQVYYTSKDPRVFASTVAPYLAKIATRESDRAPVLCSADFDVAHCRDLTVPSSMVTLIKGLSELEWAILICASRSQEKFGVPAVNLVLVQDEYRLMATHLQAQRSQGLNMSGYRIWSSKATRHVWERLEHIDLITPIGNVQGVPADLRMMKPETTLQELCDLVPHDHSLHGWTRL